MGTTSEFKRRASSDPLPDERPTKRPAQHREARAGKPPLALENMQYEIIAALDTIPAALKRKPIAKCSLEFLAIERAQETLEIERAQETLETETEEPSEGDSHQYSAGATDSEYLPDALSDSDMSLGGASGYLPDAPSDSDMSIGRSSGYLSDASRGSDVNRGRASSCLPDAPSDSGMGLGTASSSDNRAQSRGSYILSDKSLGGASSSDDSKQSRDSCIFSDTGHSDWSRSSHGSERGFHMEIDRGSSPDSSPLSDLPDAPDLTDGDSGSDDDWEKPFLNHCIIRLTFAQVQDTASRHAPAGTRGITIDPCYDLVAYQGGSFCPGEVHVNTFTYEGAHRLAKHVVDIPVRKPRGTNRHYTVADFLSDIRGRDMVPMAFTLDTENFKVGGMQGCRDFISQLIFHWVDRRLVRVVHPAGGWWGQVFNYAYGEDQVVPVKVVRASFNPDYVRLPIFGIEYGGPADPRWEPPASQ